MLKVGCEAVTTKALEEEEFETHLFKAIIKCYVKLSVSAWLILSHPLRLNLRVRDIASVVYCWSSMY